jgi:Zinc carboxypeptidase
VTVLPDETVPRALEALLRRLRGGSFRGARVEAWLFEDGASRRAAERELADRGITATLRSAYKPLLHFFLEEVSLPSLHRVEVRYPVHERADPARFLLEAYPLAGLLPGVEVHFEPGDADLHYQVELENRDGARETRRVFAPNRLRENHLGELVLAPVGWFRVHGVPDVDEAIETEYEVIFNRAVGAVRDHPWGTQEPYFERLVVHAEIPGADRRLQYGQECLSLAEALHEDLYFSLLEVLRRRGGRAADDRAARPGQIVPEIRYTKSTPRVRVAVEPSEDGEPVRPPVPLDTAGGPLSLAQVSTELARVDGQSLTARSRQGRAVGGVYRPGARPAILITAGQHGNEASGVVGALRAAHRLLAQPEAHFAVIPVENPDGYALHRRLALAHPFHLHHAGRYTAFGDDLGARERDPGFETAARAEARRLSGATLHVNLHGYPAHEWTRPLSGYIPRGFELWTIPKGFFLMVRHHAAWAERAMTFLDQLTERLGRIPELVDLNRAQLEVYRVHAGGLAFPVYHDVPCQVMADDTAPVPLAVITEFPDETIYGEAFVLAHTVQMHTVLVAEELHAALPRPAWGPARPTDGRDDRDLRLSDGAAAGGPRPEG